MASTDPPERRHRITVRILVVAASVLAFLAIFTSWIDRQLLDTDEWVDTSGRLLEDEAISNAVGLLGRPALRERKRHAPGQEATAGRPGAGRGARSGGYP